MDVQGKALYDYYVGSPTNYLLLRNNYGEPEEMPLDVFFRNEEDLPDLESYALSLCHGKILDIGAGAGSHALILQEKGMDVTAIEISPLSAQLMKARGVEKIVHEDVYKFNEEKFDTLILLMNGIGLAGDIEGFKKLLNHLSQIIAPGGQLIFDSSDIAYLYEEEKDKPMNHYYGEILYRYEYHGQKGDWFKWLYIDQETLQEIGTQCGWNVQIIFQDEDDHYLARLTFLH
jgi:SAM-dependent methyltransferase